MKKISVIGSGTMGNGIAHVFALAGYDVSIVDLSYEQLSVAKDKISANLERQVKKELITVQEKKEALSKINGFSTYEEGVKEADLIIEAVYEDENVKKEVFAKLDQCSPEKAILASNTSSLSITRIGSFTSRPDKVIGMHFMNPVPVMKLIEVIRGYSTSEDTSRAVYNLCEKLGKRPVEVNDYPGFVANRILIPMINEAVSALFEGVAGVKEIDMVMKLGMAHPMGPLELADFIGLDVCLSILNVMYKDFKNPKYAPSLLLVKMVESGNLGIKTGQGFYKYEPGVKEHSVAFKGFK